MSISAGNDMDTKVGNNDMLNVSKSQTIDIGDSKEETIAEEYQLNAKNIREEASDSMLLYSKTHEQKADSSMKLDGGKGLELKASSISLN